MTTTSSAGSITLRLVIVTLTVCLGCHFQYYNSAAVSNLVEIGQEFMNQSFHWHYGHYLTQPQMNGLWSFSTVSLQLGCLLGALITRFLGDRYGRRKALIILSVGSMTGGLCCGLSKYTNLFHLFIIGRFLIGITMGGGLPLASMFVTEIAPVRYRGACASTLHLFTALGVLLGYVLTLTVTLGNNWGWPIAVSVPPFLTGALQFLVLSFYAYESPRALVLTANDPKAGLASVKFYHGKNGAEGTVIAIKNEKRALEREKETEFRFRDLLSKPEFRRPLEISLMMAFGVYMTGLTAIVAYSKIMFLQAGLDATTSQYATIGLGLCNVLSPMVTMCIVERMGRKPVFLAGLIIAAASQIALTICLFGSLRYNLPGAALGSIPCLYIFFIGRSFAASIVIVVPAELFPQKVRASAMSVIYVFVWSIQIFVTMGYLPFAALVGVCYSYIPFIISVLVCIFFTVFFMPETKGKTVEQVAALFITRHEIKK